MLNIEKTASHVFTGAKTSPLYNLPTPNYTIAN